LIINYTYGEEFEQLFEELKKHPKYQQLADMDGIGKQCDIATFSKKFFSKKNNSPTADVSVDANANVEDGSLIAYEVESSKPVSRLNAYYLLYKYGKQLFGKETAEEMVKGQFFKDYYINDFHKFHGMPYCFNFSCLDVVISGLPFVNKIKSKPPKHLSSFMGQMIQFVTYASNSVAGAVGLADFLVCASWYVDKMYNDNPEVPHEYLLGQIKQEIQSFIFSVNQPFRGGQQSAFTNVSLFDSSFLDKICSEYMFPDGTKPNKETVKTLQRLYVELYNETLRQTPFTFPVTTACFATDDDKNIVDSEFLHEIMEQNLEFGFMNIYAGKTSTLSSCCRLRSEGDTEYFNSFGSGGTKIGSLSVVTLNLPRIASEMVSVECNCEHLRKDYFLQHIKEKTELAAKINHTKRHIVNKRVTNGNLPLYTLGFMDINRQYSTCGLNGINEAVEILGYDILKPEGQALVKDILETVNEVNRRMQQKFKTPHNTEQTPSENSSIKLAQTDKLLGYQKHYELYSNQFIPLTTKADLLDRIKLQGMFDQYMTGGAICHLNVDTRIADVKLMEDLMKHAVKQGVIYSAINYNIQQCANGHMSVGKKETCDICGAEITDNFTRVVGFLTSVKNWHKVRREVDYPERQFYKEIK
jgi:ribonucleoside-triphosphate reductase